MGRQNKWVLAAPALGWEEDSWSRWPQEGGAEALERSGVCRSPLSSKTSGGAAW
jgi:hypothetical protein